MDVETYGAGPSTGVALASAPRKYDETNWGNKGTDVVEGESWTSDISCRDAGEQHDSIDTTMDKGKGKLVEDKNLW